MNAGGYVFVGCALICCLQGCRTDEKHLFTKLGARTTNIDFENKLFEGESLNILNYAYFYNGGGVAIGDINNDGYQDILFTGNMVKNRLYLNKGDWEFEDITDKSGVAREQGWCTGATMVDVNRDGFLDIYISRSADIFSDRRRNLLFINNGDLTFTESAVEYGLDDRGYSTQASFFDYDKDGDLDCFVINHSVQRYSAGSKIDSTLRRQRNPLSACRLYRNDEGKYSDVSEQAGIISNVLTAGLGLAVSDLDADGWPDVYVANDFNEPDYLFINNADGTFREALAERMDVVSLFSMGADIADFDNDGWTDVVSLDMLPEGNRAQKMHSGPDNFDKFQALFSQGFYYQFSRNMLQKNNGDGTFSEIGQLAGVSNTDWSWAPLFADFDNDGYKDLFVTNGYVKDYTDMDFVSYSVNNILKERDGEELDPLKHYIAKMPPNPVANYMFRNNGDLTFTNNAKEWGLGELTLSTGAAYADLDNDGDLDLVTNEVNNPAGVYRNNSTAVLGNSFLKVDFNGTPNSLGAKVILHCNGRRYLQEAFVSRGFQSSVDPVLNFGLGQNSKVDSMIVIWPDDKVQKFYDLGVNQTISPEYTGAVAVSAVKPGRVASPTLLSASHLRDVLHVENVYNDFDRQRLLPNYLSRQGPCMAVSDVNGDGLEDFYLGGAKNNPGQLFVQRPSGEFSLHKQTVFLNDAGSEDTAAKFFDVDGDCDRDLYVGSGGYEFEEGHAALQDRLYVNDGKGNFSKAEGALPEMFTSTGCVSYADIDQDGDLDIFLGGRVIPGRYPLAPESRILQNDGGGRYTDVTAAIAPAIANAGMVTDALWLHVNNDSFPDLVVVGEWMPVKVFLNERGNLRDASSSYVNFPSTGWWNCLYADDMDGDGDDDLIIGNAGWNNQFKASPAEPLTLYYHDFDGNGSVDPVMCYYIDGMSYPSVSRDDLISQVPQLKKQLRTYSDYADATMGDLFREEQLDLARVLKAEMLGTVYLENRMDQGFRLHALPVEAQYSPVYAITSLDADSDGVLDLVLAGNNTWTRIKYGQQRVNHGVLLKGDGAGGFTYVPQYKSGLNLRGNVRSLHTLKNKAGDGFLLAGFNDMPVVKIVTVPD